MNEADRTERTQRWHQVASQKDPQLLGELLAEEVVFHSPVVFTPQRGKEITTLYLAAAFQVLGNAKFHYVREVNSLDHTVLEFEAEVDGTYINGVDMISWNDAWKITDFKVMVRPLQAIELLHKKMQEMLAKG